MNKLKNNEKRGQLTGIGYPHMQGNYNGVPVDCSHFDQSYSEEVEIKLICRGNKDQITNGLLALVDTIINSDGEHLQAGLILEAEGMYAVTGAPTNKKLVC